MKNVSLILNAILFLLVGILFYLHFGSKKSNNQPQVIQTDGKSVTVPQIAYVDIDSLQTRYAFFKKGVAELEASQAAAESELGRKASVFQAEYQKFMQQAQAQTLTEEQGAAMQEKLAIKKQEIDARTQQLQEKFALDSEKFNEEFKQKVVDYLIKYNASGKYTYILPYMRSAINLLYVNQANNITDEVIKGMNTEYVNEKK